MAVTTVNCTNLWYIGHNNNTSGNAAENEPYGWCTWKTIDTQNHFDYAAPSTDANGRLVCICFKAAIPDDGTSYKINLTIPAVRGKDFATSGTLYAKVYDYDPTEKTVDGKKVKITKKEAKKLIPTSSKNDGSASWSRTDRQIFNISISVKSSLVKKDAYCYVVLGSSKLLQIGASETAGRKFSGTVEYYTKVGIGTVSITDNGDNTFKVTGTKGANGTNNPASGPTLTWGYSKTDCSKAVSNPNKLEASTILTSRTVYAKCVTKATYGEDSEVITSASIKNYVAPGKPGVPEISHTKSRLTIKEDWTYNWLMAAPGNLSSTIAGYRVRLYKNGNLIRGLTHEGTKNGAIKLGLNKSSILEYLDTEEVTSKVTFDPNTFGYVPGDKVKLSVTAYAKNGKGTQLFGNNGYPVESVESLVQNAGVVRVKTAAGWKEGQVYVRVNGTWKEADVIKVKTSTGWKESE